MTDAMIVEAVRAVQTNSAADPSTTGAAAAVADPAAVERFQAAMGVGGVNAAPAVDPIPFASEASAAWRSAQTNNQGILHRIRALSRLEKMHGPSSGELVELQYEVMNLAFQQEVVTKVADKSSNAIQTLVKNQ
jgi:type III secretion system YscI/HrpB-like protein